MPKKTKVSVKFNAKVLAESVMIPGGRLEAGMTVATVNIPELEKVEDSDKDISAPSTPTSTSSNASLTSVSSENPADDPKKKDSDSLDVPPVTIHQHQPTVIRPVRRTNFRSNLGVAFEDETGKSKTKKSSTSSFSWLNPRTWFKGKSDKEMFAEFDDAMSPFDAGLVDSQNIDNIADDPFGGDQDDSQHSQSQNDDDVRTPLLSADQSDTLSASSNKVISPGGRQGVGVDLEKDEPKPNRLLAWFSSVKDRLTSSKAEKIGNAPDFWENPLTHEDFESQDNEADDNVARSNNEDDDAWLLAPGNSNVPQTKADKSVKDTSKSATSIWSKLGLPSFFGAKTASSAAEKAKPVKTTSASGKSKSDPGYSRVNLDKFESNFDNNISARNMNREPELGWWADDDSDEWAPVDNNQNGKSKVLIVEYAEVGDKSGKQLNTETIPITVTISDDGFDLEYDSMYDDKIDPSDLAKFVSGILKTAYQANPGYKLGDCFGGLEVSMERGGQDVLGKERTNLLTSLRNEIDGDKELRRDASKRSGLTGTLRNAVKNYDSMVGDSHSSSYLFRAEQLINRTGKISETALETMFQQTKVFTGDKRGLSKEEIKDLIALNDALPESFGVLDAHTSSLAAATTAYTNAKSRSALPTIKLPKKKVVKKPEATVVSLSDRVDKQGLIAQNNKGRGNCLHFAALDQIQQRCGDKYPHYEELKGLNATSEHTQMRSIIAGEVEKNRPLYLKDSLLEGEGFQNDLRILKITQDGFSGDRLELQAIANHFNVNIHIEGDGAKWQPYDVSVDPHLSKDRSTEPTSIGIGYYNGDPGHYVSLRDKKPGALNALVAKNNSGNDASHLSKRDAANAGNSSATSQAPELPKRPPPTLNAGSSSATSQAPELPKSLPPSLNAGSSSDTPKAPDLPKNPPSTSRKFK